MRRFAELPRIAATSSSRAWGRTLFLEIPYRFPEAGNAFGECLSDNDIAVNAVTAYVGAEGELSIETEGRGDPASAATDAPLESGCYEDVARAFGFRDP